MSDAPSRAEEGEVVASHTPGPWWADEYRRYGGSMSFGHIAIWAPNAGAPSEPWFICDVRMTEDRQRAEREANARLIAAAPDLLEALRAVVAVADRSTVEFDAARAAIAKATGQQSEAR